MELLVPFLALLVVNVVALRWGVDTASPRADGRRWFGVLQ